MQEVGTQDVFFNLHDKDPSTNHCDAILIKVWLPNTAFKNVQLDIQGQMLMVQSPVFVLNKLLPFKVDKNGAKAKFDSDKCVLEVRLPVIKKDIVDAFFERNEVIAGQQ
jgi:HSP20 family molecular chaperone IbpA